MTSEVIRHANAAWEALFRAHTTLLRQFAQDDIWEPVTMREYDVLYTLKSGAPTGMRLRELVECTLMPQPSLSRMVERLEHQGLVQRLQAADDGRGIIVTLTERGRLIQRQVGHRHGAAVSARMTAGLNAQEMAELKLLCEKLTTTALAESPQSQAHHTLRKHW